MKREPAWMALAIATVACSCALLQDAKPIIKTIIDLADEACMATFSDPNLAPDLVKVVAGRTARQVCNDTAIARQFLDAQKSAQSAAKASLSRSAQ